MNTQFTNKFGFNVEIKYTRRQGSIGFQVRSHGVRVLAPQRTPVSVLERMLLEKQGWITAQLKKLEERPTLRPQRQFKSGDKFPFMGNLFPLSVINSLTSSIELDSGYLCIDINCDSEAGEYQSRCTALIEQWLQQEAQAYLPKKLEFWSEQMALAPASLKIRHYQSRWGSCDQRARITLNNHLMLAPDSIIDYVIIHELSHLRHLNHSADFWRQVERFCPDYRAKRRWLKSNTQALQVDIDGGPLSALP